MVYAVIIGLVIGMFAKILMPGRDPGGIVVTILLGISGSLLARYLGRALGWYDAGEPAGFIGSLFGAMILLFLYRKAFGRKA